MNRKADFDKAVGAHQVTWRQAHVADQRHGMQDGKSRPWVLPPELWEEGLWPGIRSGSAHSLPAYLAEKRVTKHKGVHNLKSSWMLCANLYFPLGASADGRAVLAAFLHEHVAADVRTVDALELEYAEEGNLHPSALLGEQGGARGTGQTSPDVAFLVNDRKGLILAESKLAEHSFFGPGCGPKGSSLCPVACILEPGLRIIRHAPNPERACQDMPAR